MTQQVQPIKAPCATSGKQEVSIRALVEWAFQRELVGLDLTGRGDIRLGYGYASATHAIIQHEQLGCRIDGGGTSPSHPDADMVADALAVLPESVGGQRMGLWIAELARAGQVPDWCPNPKPACRPVEWRQSKHGSFAKTMKIGEYRYTYRGRTRVCEVRVCPVRYTDTAQHVARARRQWLQWRAALLELKTTFQIYGGLSAFTVNDQLPPTRPWDRSSSKALDG